MGRTLENPPVADLVEEGRRTAAETGCFKCHTVDGSPHIGPTWLDMYQRTEKMTSGEEQRVDEGYITRSIMDPLAQLVSGYAPVMPTYQGLVSEEGVMQLIAYIQSLQEPAAKGAPLAVAPHEAAPPARARARQP